VDVYIRRIEKVFAEIAEARAAKKTAKAKPSKTTSPPFRSPHPRRSEEVKTAVELNTKWQIIQSQRLPVRSRKKH
jgi:hypothetical protein